jgi:hypothetical protein
MEGCVFQALSTSPLDRPKLWNNSSFRCHVPFLKATLADPAYPPERHNNAKMQFSAETGEQAEAVSVCGPQIFLPASAFARAKPAEQQVWPPN